MTGFPEGLDSTSPWDLSTFDPLEYIYFNIAFVLIAYPLYRIIAGHLNWELTEKSPSKHFSDFFACVRYGFIVFVVGGYSETFSWITVLSFYIAMYGYGLLAELPFAKQSLPTWRNWAVGMWILFMTGLVIILAMAGYHIYLALEFTGIGNPSGRDLNVEFLAWYLGCLIIPVILLLNGILVVKEQNQRILTKEYLKIVNVFKIKKQGGPNETNGNENDAVVVPVAEGAGQETTLQSYPNVQIHLHHWQIFYVLAFFTRFKQPVSQVAGGIVLGIYTEGMVAYGPDNFLIERAS